METHAPYPPCFAVGDPVFPAEVGREVPALRAGTRRAFANLMTVNSLLRAAVLGLVITFVPQPAGQAWAAESDTVRVTRELDRQRDDRARVLQRRDRIRDTARARESSRIEARRQADIERRGRLTAEPTNRLSDRLYFRPGPLGTAARPR